MVQKTASLLVSTVAAMGMSLSANAAEFQPNQMLRNNPDIAESIERMNNSCDQITQSRRSFISCLGDTQRAMTIMCDSVWEGLNTAFRNTNPADVVTRAQHTAGATQLETLCINPLRTPRSGQLEHVLPALLDDLSTGFNAVMFTTYGHYDLSRAPVDNFSRVLDDVGRSINRLENNNIPQ